MDPAQSSTSQPATSDPGDSELVGHIAMGRHGARVVLALESDGNVLYASSLTVQRAAHLLERELAQQPIEPIPLSSWAANAPAKASHPAMSMEDRVVIPVFRTGTGVAVDSSDPFVKAEAATLAGLVVKVGEELGNSPVSPQAVAAAQQKPAFWGWTGLDGRVRNVVGGMPSHPAYHASTLRALRTGGSDSGPVPGSPG